MHANQDLNSNLIRSLTSVHLPPPPSSHIKPSHHSQHQHQTNLPEKQENVAMQHLHPQSFIIRPSRISDSSEELPLPLTTPPHTISRHERRSYLKKRTKNIDDTPTLTTGRTKKHTAQKPVSPQYSSPSASNANDNSGSKRASKPSPPSFNSGASAKSKKQASVSEENENFVLPLPEHMPEINHDSDTKPPYSYATLIGMAILRGPDRKLTLSQIYSWISSTFRYYRRNDVGWQNSIRHNLSLNKAFIKTEKSSDGKGHYWEIAKGFEMQFFKGKTGRKIFGGVQVDTSNLQKKAPIQVQRLTESLLSPDIATLKKKTTNPSIDSSDDEFDSSDEDGGHSKTPRAQITSTDDDYIERPSLRKSHTAIGLQKFSISGDTHGLSCDEDDDGDSQFGSNVPRKRLQTRAVLTGNGLLQNIPSLEAPNTNWAASASGKHIIFGQIRPDQFTESPKNKATLPYTSSFSCNTNFELSPLKRQETGPLLEPLTPSSRLSSFNNQSSGLTNITITTSESKVETKHLANSNNLSNTSHLAAPSLSSTSNHSLETPLRPTMSNIQSITNSAMGSSAQSNNILNFLKTPTNRIKTPNSNSILRKFWNSPSFIDDFYTSPSVPRNSDDDYHKALFGSPNKKTSSDSKAAYFEHSGTYADLFGVDICSVVKRAVECAKDQREKPRNLLSGEHNGSSTDDEFDGNATV